MSASVVRWVMSLSSGTWPARIEAATWSKSTRVALRLPISIISRLWNSGSEKVISSLTTLTSTSAPPCATWAKAAWIEPVLPVASKTRSKPSPPVAAFTLSATGASGPIVAGKAEFARREVEALAAHVEQRDVMAGDAREDRRAEADRAGADDQRARALARERAAHGVRADGQELDGGGRLQRQAVCRIKIARGHEDLLAHGAVAMDAEHGDRHAAVRLVVAAGDAGAAGQIGVDHDRFADREVDAVADRRDHAGHFVAHDARILQERVLALEDVVVGAADADMADRDQRPARRRASGARYVGNREFAGCAADDGFHGRVRGHDPASRCAVSGRRNRR